jgi:curli biogenesis system outer membrane secretion channel CsgG
MEREHKLETSQLGVLTMKMRLLGGLLSFGFLISALFAACAGSPVSFANQSAAENNGLDASIRDASNYLNKQLPKGSKLLFLNVRSEFPALSEYIIDELIANTVNDRIFTVVDRQQLNIVRSELNFQMSGEVSDESAQSIGQILGAQFIVSGTVSQFGELFRLRISALNVQRAQIMGQYNRNISGDSTISALVKIKAADSNVKPASTVKAAAGQTIQASTPAAPEAPVYKIGDKGPAGGIIFYDKENNSGGWRYLEAAPARNEFKAQWGNVKAATGDDVGSGKVNTQRIKIALEERGEITRAAHRCTQLAINGFNDWFLPSKGELSWMYVNLKERNIGGFGNGWYWSSSIFDNWYATGARALNFGDGAETSVFGDNRNETYSVRAIRAF